MLAIVFCWQGGAESVWSCGNMVCHLFSSFTKDVYIFQYLINRQVTLEERCTLLCMLTDYLAGECVALGLLDSSNKYNTQSFVLLEELTSAWNYTLQQARIVEGMKEIKEMHFFPKETMKN